MWTWNEETNSATLALDGLPALVFQPFEGGVRIRQESTGINLAAITSGGGHYNARVFHVVGEAYWPLDNEGYPEFAHD